jgi:hypothetical protein
MRNRFTPVLASQHVANGPSAMLPASTDLSTVGGDRGTWSGTLVDEWVSYDA